MSSSPLGIYVHVPFCAHSCGYCAFYQERPTRDLVEQYLVGVKLEVQRYLNTEGRLTLFFGGGTPTALSMEQLQALAATVRSHFTGKILEWTVEAAPATVNVEKLRCLKNLGVTRISLGLQSLSDKKLQALQRRHTAQRARGSYALAREVDFENINCDLIFGAQGETLADWEADLHAVAQLGPEHISTYCLTYEHGTAQTKQLDAGAIEKKTEGDECAFYERAQDILSAYGYEQYEISNYAKPGYACLHNLNTWRMGAWIGLGPAAASQFGGKRYQNPASIHAWHTALSRGEDPSCECVQLTEKDTLCDAIIFGLRMRAGVELGVVDAACAVWPHLKKSVDAVIAEGYAECLDGHLRLTRGGLLLCDAITAYLFED